MSKNLVIIPTYNERENISDIIHVIMDLKLFDVLVVDDGSPDGTADIVTDLAQSFGPRVMLHQRGAKLGLGTAYIAGFKKGIDLGYDYIVEMDADFSHDPMDLPRLLQACEQGSDVSIGSRYVSGGGVENWPIDRLVLSRGASLYVRMISWMPIMDPTAGFVCYHRRVLETLDLDKIEFVGYAFQIEMKYAAYNLGFKLVEVPIVFKERERGQSKMHLGIVKEAIQGVLKLKMRSLKNKTYYKR